MRWLAAMMAMLLALPAAAQPVHAPGARTETGMVGGKRQGNVSAFLGIPFAASTGGANRWRAPQPAARWAGIRDATRFAADCQQDIVPHRGAIGPWTWEYLAQGPAGEDCLFVNIWTPDAPPGARLPVLVWIYGGGFTSGSGAVPLYDGAALAARGIVVVSINYRVGVYGLLAHPELTREAGASGNYALLDQIAGLEWVRRNIAGFGGDPGQVTIAGQSAGAASVHALLAAPRARGLFHRAIAQSGSGMGNDFPPLAAAEAQGTRFADAAGAKSLADLRALTPAQVTAAAQGMRFGLTGGTPLLPGTAGTSGIPVLTGLTADEGSAIGGDYAIDSEAAIRATLDRRYGASAAAFVPLYPATDPATAAQSARLMSRERGIAAMLAWARARRPGAAPVFAYLYTHAEPGSAPQYRAFHSAELAYVFGTLDVTPERGFTAQDRAIAGQMGDYWANFVRTGDPNSAGAPLWPRLESGRIMALGDRFAPMVPLRPEARAAFDAYAASGGRLTLF
ncbi:MAG: carboxylesterase family protein [Pseudomonadota bacterium]